MSKLTTKSGITLSFDVGYPIEVVNGKTSFNIIFKESDFNYNIIEDAKEGCHIDIIGVHGIEKAITLDQADISVKINGMNMSTGTIEFFANPKLKMEYRIKKDLYGRP